MLEKLRPLHPLPGVILEWRRITNALTKVVFPLQREKKYHTALSMDRIYPIAQTHTATGKTHTDTHIKRYMLSCRDTLMSFANSCNCAL